MPEKRRPEAIAAIDRLIHEPARLLIVTHLSAVKKADFVYLLRMTGLTNGNLSTHLTRLEDAGYVAITKSFEGKSPHTLCVLTKSGKTALGVYAQVMNGLLKS